MSHSPKSAELCLDYVMGGMTEKDVAKVEEHLSECNHCQRLVELYRQIKITPDRVAAEFPAGSAEGFTEKLLLRKATKKRILAWALQFVNYEQRRDATTSRSPGALLSSLADFCSPKTRERVLEPIISDMRVEFSHAVAENRKAGAVWIRIRGYWSFWTALGVHILKKSLAKMWRISGLG